MIYPLLLCTGALIFLFIALKRFPLALHLFLALLPTYLLRFSIGPIPTNLLEVFFLILLGAFLLEKRSLPSLNAYKPWRVPIALLCVALVLSIITAPSLLEALNIAKSYYIEPALFTVILLGTVKTREEWRGLIRTLLLVASVLGGVALFQTLFRLGIPAPWDIEGRAVSLFPYPNAYGLFATPIIASGLALFFTRREGSWLLLMILPVLGLFATKTEAGILALILLTATLFVFTVPKSWRSQLATSSVFALVLLLTLLVPPIRQKVFLLDSSGLVRRSQWSETTELLRDTPILGAGLNGYPTALVPYHDAHLYEIFQYPHNLILNIWVELGLLGVISIALFFAIALRRFSAKNDPLEMVVFSVFFVMIVHGLVDVPFFKNDLAFLTVFFFSLGGYLTARSQMSKSLRKAPIVSTE